MIGREQRFHPDYSLPEKLYISLLGVPVVGLRIRCRNVLKLIPESVQPARILDAGSGPGVITFSLACKFPDADVVGVDLVDDAIRTSRIIAQRGGFVSVRFEKADLRDLPFRDYFDLVTCVDILEHIEDDHRGIEGLYHVLRPGGTLVLHVPSFYRRYPVFRKALNFDVPTHVRPGYELDEIVQKVRDVGFNVQEKGLTYGLLETFANNISYMITKANKRNREIYALVFPWLNAIGWFGRYARPRELGAGVFVVARKSGTDQETAQ
jgi:SAM-dependent methyltransferase